MGRGGEVGTSLSLLSLSLPQMGYGCIELEKKGNMTPEVEEALTERSGPHTCSVCTCWLTRVVFSFKLVMESLARTNPLLTPLWGRTGDSQGSVGVGEQTPTPKESLKTGFTP